MKNLLLFMAICMLCACTESIALQNGEAALLESWTLKREGATDTFEAKVPSTVAGVLYEQNYFGEDILTGTVYFDVDRTIFDAPWIYNASFRIDREEGQYYTLVFDGINYYADIALNGSAIASSDTTSGVFLRREYDVTALLENRNNLEVKVSRAERGDLNIGFVDWNPRPLDESMGIVRPVRLIATGAISIDDVFVIPSLDTESFADADLELRVSLKNRSDAPKSAEILIDLQDAGVCRVPVELQAGEERMVSLTPEQAANLHVDEPRVWWSYDLGTPELYTLNVAVETEGRVSDNKEVTFGIREITSRLNEQGYRQFTLNGKDILLKGAGWTDDIFLRDTHESIDRQLQYVMDMNMNCVRFENIWGKDDTVYDLCDRYGLLALVGWSCQWEWESYCGIPEIHNVGCIYEPDKIDLAVAYFEDQVKRLHNHPSVSAWLTGSDCVPIFELEQRYLEIFEQYDYRPYISSAKSFKSELTGWSGTKMAGPYEYVAPDYWYVDTENGGAFGFNTETGIGANIPQAESLVKMIPEDQLWPLSDAWDKHCTTSSSMNSMKVLTAAMNAMYGEALDFNDYVRKGHALDYDGTRAMFEAFRVNTPLTTGLIQWMLNSAWPSIYWQLYDYYGVPVAAYYGTKKACEPLQLIYNYKDSRVYLVNEGNTSGDVIASVKVFDDASALLYEEETRLFTSYRNTVAAFDLSEFDGRPHFIALELETAENETITDNFYCIAAKRNEYNWRRNKWYYTPISEYSDLSFAFGQQPADVSMETSWADGVYSVILTNKGRSISYMNILKALDENGELVVPAYWSDNFFALLPGQTKTVNCRTEKKNVNIILNN